MSRLLEHITQFNRKERFFLVGLALGNERFALSKPFRAKVGQALNLTIPPDAFVAMDYHLDWVYASLFLASSEAGSGPHCNTDKLIHAHQEDIDLIVAYQDGETHHIVLLEAKGATGWTNKQLTSKANRFREIFGDPSGAFPGVEPHFVIASPTKPDRLQFSTWPKWMAPHGKIPWFELLIPDLRKKVTRCDAAGAIANTGDHWRIIPDRGRYDRRLEPCSRCGREDGTPPAAAHRLDDA